MSLEKKKKKRCNGKVSYLTKEEEISFITYICLIVEQTICYSRVICDNKNDIKTRSVLRFVTFTPSVLTLYHGP